MKIKKNDLVKILSGKDAGKTGKVLHVLAKKGEIVVEGINKVKKHLRRMDQDRPGQIVEINKPIDSSNANLVCPKCQKSTRIGFKFEGGKKLRVCKKCQEIII